MNIPFSKDAKSTPQKPGSAAGRMASDSDKKVFGSPQGKLSQSHANTFMSGTSRNSVTGKRSDLEAVLARKQNMATL